MDLYNASLADSEEESEMVLTLEEYEDAKATMQKIIDRAEMARRLSENDDFKGLILEGYLTDEPKRLAELMASGRLQEMSLNNCTKDMDAIGRFRNYMKMFIEQGNMAKDELQSLEEAREESILQEEKAT